MRPGLALILLAALTLASADGRADDPITIRWSLKKGETFYLKQTIARDQTSELDGRKTNSKSEITTVVRFKVAASLDSGTVMEMTYLDVRISSQGGRPRSIDPNDRLAGVSMTVTVDGKQTVTKLEGHDTFLDRLSGGDDAVRKQLEKILPESTVCQIVTLMFVPTPERPVKVGDSWAKVGRVRLGELGEMTTDSKFKLERVEDGAATVGVGGKATLKLGGGGGAVPFKIVKSDLKVEKYHGRYVFDLRAGRPRESTTEMVTTGAYTIESDGETTEIAVRQQQTTTIQISDQNPLQK